MAPTGDEDSIVYRLRTEREIKMLDTLEKVYGTLMASPYFPGNMALLALLDQTIKEAKGEGL